MLLLGVCSVPVSAEEVEHKSYYIYTMAQHDGNTLFAGMHYPKDTTRQNFTYDNSLSVAKAGTKVTFELYVANNDKTPLYNKGDIVTGKLENLYINVSVKVPNIALYPLNITWATAYLLYTDSTSEIITCTIEKDRNGYYVLDYSFESKKDVSQLYFIVGTSALPSSAVGKVCQFILSAGEPSETDEPNDNIVFGSLYGDVESPEVGWLAKIWNKLTSGFKDIVDAITGLPGKLWGLIEDGLKSLFVPDGEYLTTYADKWKVLLSDRLGAVYQVIEITFGAWEDVQLADEMDTVEFPEVSIPLPDNNEFSFGGYTVKVVPDGFQTLASALKWFLGVACTFMFINGLRKKYEEVMAVEK